MGHDEAAKLLQENLDEEKAADEKLTAIAEGGINQQAADLAHPDADEEDEEEAPAKPAAKTKANGSKTAVAKPMARAAGRR